MCLFTQVQRARGGQVTNYLFDFYKMSRTCVGWFAIFCLCHTVVCEDKCCTMVLKGSPLCYFEVAEEAEAIDISKNIFMSFRRDVSRFRGLWCQSLKASPCQ